MAHSLSHFVRQRTGSITHPLSGTTFVVKPNGDSAEVAMTRDGTTVTYPIAYEIGSGTHAFGYLAAARLR